MPFGFIEGIKGLFGKSDAQLNAAAQNRFNKLQAAYTYQSQLRDYGAEVSNIRNQLAFSQAKASQEIAIAKAVANQEWQFTNAVNRFNYIRESTNAELNWQYRTAAQKMDWQLQQTLQDAEYRASMRAFEQSEKTFAEQLRLNSQAAASAYEGSQLQMRAAQMSSIIEADSARRETAKQKGAVAASGRSGASMARLQMDAQQQYANDLGLLATNLAFAQADFNVSQQDAYLATQSANAEAESRRMLRPMDKINIPRPIDIPKAYIPQPIQTPRPLQNFIKPIMPKRAILPSAPTRAPVPVVRGPSRLSYVGQIGESVLRAFSMGQSLTPTPAPPATTGIP
jgi:hypothetical protein